MIPLDLPPPPTLLVNRPSSGNRPGQAGRRKYHHGVTEKSLAYAKESTASVGRRQSWYPQRRVYQYQVESPRLDIGGVLLVAVVVGHLRQGFLHALGSLVDLQAGHESGGEGDRVTAFSYDAWGVGGKRPRNTHASSSSISLPSTSIELALHIKIG